MRIALTLRSFDEKSGGEARWTRGFAAYLVGSGHDVHIVSGALGAPVCGVSGTCVDESRSPLSFARAVNARLAELRPQTVHDSGVACWRGILQPQSGSLLHSLDTSIAAEPALLRVRAALSPKMIILRERMRILERRQQEAATRIIAISSLVASMLRARRPSIARKILVSPNGVDSERFAIPATGLSGTGSPDRPLRIAVVAQMPRLKGFGTTLQAVAELRRRGVSVRLDLAGVDMAPNWRARIARAGLDDAVVFHGFVDDVSRIYAGADLLVHPARWDAFGLVVLEAMAAGIPVIVTRRCGAAECVADGRNGFLLEDPDDWRGLADIIARLVSPDLRRTVGEAGRMRARQASLARNYAEIAEELCKACSPTAPQP